MTAAALPPNLALAYLRALSTDLRSAAVATADGVLLGGDPGLLTRAAEGEDVTVGTDGSRVLSARDDAHQIVVLAGPHVLTSVLALDLRAALLELRTR